MSNSTFNALVMRYSDQSGRIYFDDFIMCSIRLKSMFGKTYFCLKGPTSTTPAQVQCDQLYCLVSAQGNEGSEIRIFLSGHQLCKLAISPPPQKPL